MGWLRLDDNFGDHPKLVQLTASQRWTWLEVLLYCSRFRTPEIPTGIRQVIRGATPVFLARCREIGLVDGDPDAYRVHDFDQFNPPRDPTNAARQARYRQTHSNGEVTEKVTPGLTPRAQPRAPVPSPSPTPFLIPPSLASNVGSDPDGFNGKIEALIRACGPGSDEKIRRTIKARKCSYEKIVRALDAAQAPSRDPLAVALSILAPKVAA